MSHEDLIKQLNEIENEIKNLGLWVQSVSEPVQVNSAFGGAEMPFEHWLALVFLPAARKAITENILPKRSQVGVAAMRNFDGSDEMNNLVSLLGKFDHAVESAEKKALTRHSSGTRREARRPSTLR
jgi:uncharacterized protein YqcC (DUF446 family)